MTKTEFIQRNVAAFIPAALHFVQLKDRNAEYIHLRPDADAKKRDLVKIAAEICAMQADELGLTDEAPVKAQDEKRAPGRPAMSRASA